MRAGTRLWKRGYSRGGAFSSRSCACVQMQSITRHNRVLLNARAHTLVAEQSTHR